MPFAAHVSQNPCALHLPSKLPEGFLEVLSFSDLNLQTYSPLSNDVSCGTPGTPKSADKPRKIVAQSTRANHPRSPRPAGLELLVRQLAHSWKEPGKTVSKLLRKR